MDLLVLSLLILSSPPPSQSTFDVVRKVLSPDANENLGIHARTELFFQDYQMGPLFVQENYLHVKPNAAG